jgi:hypothetical protein
MGHRDTAFVVTNTTPPGVGVGEAAATTTATALSTTMGLRDTAAVTTNNTPQPPTIMETKSTTATTTLVHYQQCRNDFQPLFSKCRIEAVGQGVLVRRAKLTSLDLPPPDGYCTADSWRQFKDRTKSSLILHQSPMNNRNNHP